MGIEEGRKKADATEEKLKMKKKNKNWWIKQEKNHNTNTHKLILYYKLI